MKLGKKRRESSKRNYYIISPRMIIKAIIIIRCICTVAPKTKPKIDFALKPQIYQDLGKLIFSQKFADSFIAK